MKTPKSLSLQVYSDGFDSISVNHWEIQTIPNDISTFKKFLNSITTEIKNNPKNAVEIISAKEGSIINPFTGSPVKKEFLIDLYTKVKFKLRPQSKTLSEKEKVLIESIASLFSSADIPKYSDNLFGSLIMAMPFNSKL